MRHSVARSIRVLWTMVMLALVGVAEAAPRDLPAFERASAMREARAHFQIGLRHYNLGEFDRAIVEFKLAYRRSEAPGLLFNIAQAHRARGDARSALHFYAAYLRVDPRARERAYVESRIRQLEQQLEPVPAPETAPAEAPVASADDPEVHVVQAAAVLTAAPRARETGRAMKIAGIATATAGAAALIAGGYYSIQAASAAEEISDLSKNNGRWSKRFDDVSTEGRQSEITAAVLYAVGGAAVVTGGVLYWFGVRREASAARLTVAPESGGMRLGMRWKF